MKNINEVWHVLKFNGIDPIEHYELSNYGNVKVIGNRARTVKISEIKGYPFVNIKLTNEKRVTKYIHKLVAEYFLPTPASDQNYVVHLDFNKSNNHFRNLKWVSREELTRHHKNNPNQVKGIIRNAKLTETDVIRLKKKLLRGKNPLYKIAREFGITHTQLNRIRSGENWGHIQI